MSSADFAHNQAVYVHTARGWTPKRGLHRGLKCDVCGVAKSQMFESSIGTRCKEHAEAVA